MIVDFSEEALLDLKKHHKAGNKSLVKKINDFIKSVLVNPKTGIGKPEPLKYKKIETWSRRISEEHRFIYEIHSDFIQIISLWGHYDDK